MAITTLIAQRDNQKNSCWLLYLFIFPPTCLRFPVLFSPLPVPDLPVVLVNITLSSRGSTQGYGTEPCPSPLHALRLPVKSSGAIWIGVPTMLPDIMASGLQNPKSVILARFCLSNCQQSRARVTLCLVLQRVASPNSQVGIYNLASRFVPTTVFCPDRL